MVEYEELQAKIDKLQTLLALADQQAAEWRERAYKAETALDLGGYNVDERNVGGETVAKYVTQVVRSGAHCGTFASPVIEEAIQGVLGLHRQIADRDAYINVMLQRQKRQPKQHTN